MPDLTPEFSLCTRAAALGVPFVPEGWGQHGSIWVSMRMQPTAVGGDTECVFVTGDEADPIDAAAWRDAASEWLATNSDFFIIAPNAGEWAAHRATNFPAFPSFRYPTRHATLVAAVTQVLDAKENER